MNGSMSKQQSSRVTDHFRQSRADTARGSGPATRSGKKAGDTAQAPTAAVATPPALPPAEQQAESDEAALRQFDLDSRFGPCSGITRLQRWERAVKLGLSPPPQVPQIVQRYGEDSDFNRDLFANGKI